MPSFAVLKHVLLLRDEGVALGAILLGALILRVCGLDFGLPQLFHADEAGYVDIAQQIVKSGDLNPHFFNYPSLFFYLNALAYLPYFAVGWLSGSLSSLSDIEAPQSLGLAVGFTTQPGTLILARSLTALAALAAIGATYRLARRLGSGKLAGLVAALLLAVSPIAVDESRFVAPDAFVALFATLSVGTALRAYDGKKLVDYIAAGVCVGPTASAKYNGAVVGIAVLVAALLERRFSGRALLASATAGLAAITSFFVTSPFVLLDHENSLTAIAFESKHYATGHSGVVGSSALFYLEQIVTRETVIAVLSVLTLLTLILRRDRRLLVVWSFPVGYFAFISRFPVHNQRTLLPLIPVLAALSGVVVAQIVARIRDLVRRPAPRFAAYALLLASLVLWPLRNSIAQTRELLAPNARDLAMPWINAHVPPGSSIALEGYGPYIDPKRYHVTGLGYLTYKPVSFYRSRFDYLVFSSGAFQRFFEHPEVFRKQVRGYNALFRSFRLVKTFEQGGEVTRIYATDRAVDPKKE